jgi:hypothetical protein
MYFEYRLLFNGWTRFSKDFFLINEVVNFFKFRLSKDYRETGKCRVYIGKTVKGYGFAGLVLKKGNENRNSINQG